MKIGGNTSTTILEKGIGETMPKQPPVVLREKREPRKRYTIFGVESGKLGSDYVCALNATIARVIVYDKRPEGYEIYCVFNGYIKPIWNQVELFIPDDHPLSTNENDPF